MKKLFTILTVVVLTTTVSFGQAQFGVWEQMMSLLMEHYRYHFTICLEEDINKKCLYTIK